MIAFLKGRLAAKTESSVVIDVGGVGYAVGMSAHSLPSMPAVGEPVQVYTYLLVREDALTLYGFANMAEKALFERLISVSGVANAAAVLTGKTIGEGSRGRVQKVANTLLLFSVLVGVFNCLLVLVIRPLFLLLYNVTPETYEAAYTIIGVLACLQLVLGIDVTCIVGILRGGGDTRTAFVYDCGALWLVSIPMGILAGLVLHLPVPLVYVCLKLDSPIKAFLSLLRIRSGKWIRNVTVQTSPMPPEEEAQRAAGME